MGTLICITYEDEYRALEVFPSLLRLQAGSLIDIDDTLAILGGQSGTVRALQLVHVPNSDVDQDFWRTLLHALIVTPLRESQEEGGDTSASSLLAQLGIAADFAANLRHRLRPGTSALLIRIRRPVAAWTIPEVSRFGGTIAMTPLRINLGAASLPDQPEEEPNMSAGTIDLL
jgi:uncharacterized membrane protein